MRERCSQMLERVYVSLWSNEAFRTRFRTIVCRSRDPPTCVGRCWSISMSEEIISWWSMVHTYKPAFVGCLTR